jgi:hypothetical protein
VAERATASETGWLRGLQVVVAVAAATTLAVVLFWTAATVFYSVQRSTGESDVTIAATLPGGHGLPVDRAPDGLAEGVELAPHQALRVAIDRPSAPLYALAVLGRLPTTLVYAAFFVLLWRLVRAARRRDPFSAEHARRLRVLGGLLAGGALTAAVLEALARGMLSAMVLTSDRFVFSYDVPGGALIGGLGLLAVAEVVRAGARMREDLEGTV